MAVLTDPVTTQLAFWSTWISNALTVYLIVQHIRNYTQPQYQRYICRIVFIVPFYCTASWLALQHREHSLYFETPRDCYEAWVIYNFMSLCFAYVGGPGAVVIQSEGKIIKKSWLLCNCCLKPMPVDGFFLRNCKQGTLQFVIAKPFLAFFTLFLFVIGKYNVGAYRWDDGYGYIAFIYNVCYAVALFWMLLFYVGCEELLHPFKPLMKFFVFKTVIFLTFWQGLLVTFLATRFGWDEEDAEAIMNWLVCVEMFFAAVGMLFAFPHTEYQLGGAATPGWRWDALKHAISITDVIEDIMLQFDPDYKSYVLHTDGGPSEAVKRKKFRGKKKKLEHFSVTAVRGMQEFGSMVGGVAGKLKMKKLGTRRGAALDGNVSSTGLESAVDEEGEWYSAARRDNIFDGVKRVTVNTAKQAGKVAMAGLAFIPGITELERRQADLIDSESDAEMDEENQKDNQLDDDMMTSSDSHDSVDEQGHVRRHHSHHHRNNRSTHGRQRLATSSNEASGDETEAPYQQRMGGRLATAGSDTDAAFGRKGKGARSGVVSEVESDWAQFPDPFKATPGMVVAKLQDSSWACFPAEFPPAPTAAAAAAAAAPGAAGSGGSWATFDNVPLDGSAPPPAPRPAPTAAQLGGAGAAARKPEVIESVAEEEEEEQQPAPKAKGGKQQAPAAAAAKAGGKGAAAAPKAAPAAKPQPGKAGKQAAAAAPAAAKGKPQQQQKPKQQAGPARKGKQGPGAKQAPPAKKQKK
mmetsp:Transcript_18411/g.46560  ORF Transcript_18411/g.46560 Transcript_18411/m.46560 type:complete len:746 (-) Transcript_18411:337-2574(-)